ncbi:uncharacterized protein LOC143912617 [Arctopsyche grandis]|uniref:uncharacterized protein LOC143912617 n=1 Tax=Arctopsyche grandis TaxID=121162 RepID=UPI00406D6591
MCEIVNFASFLKLELELSIGDPFAWLRYVREIQKIVNGESQSVTLNNQQSSAKSDSASKQTVRKQNAGIHSGEFVNTRNKCIFEPRPELTYNDINNLYKPTNSSAKSSRAPVRYIGANTDSQLNYTESDSRQPPKEQKLFRRESIIASWQYLKKEQERALGGQKSVQTFAPTARRGRKVTRSHSAKENATNLRRFSSKRKSVIYSFDPTKQVLNEEYTFASDESEVCDSDQESFTERGSKIRSNLCLRHIDGELYPCQKSSSFDKIKCLLLRVFTNNNKTQ